MTPTQKLWSGVRKRVNRLRSDIVLGRSRGAALLLDQTNWIDGRLLSGRPFENDQLDRFSERLSGEDYDLMIDIGSNFGLYAVLAGLKGIDEVWAFEPVRRTYNQLCANVFANRLDAVVRTHAVAVSDVDGSATIHVAPKSSGISRLAAEDPRGGDALFTDTETIETIRFDSHFGGADRRIYMKIDVEGHEEKALAGMQHFLQANTVDLQIEMTRGRETALAEHLERWGFRKEGEIEEDAYFTNRPHVPT